MANITHCFEDDIKNDFSAELSALGYTLDPNDDADKILRKYLYVKKRSISVQKRSVLFSNELNLKLTALSAPVYAGISMIKSKSENGEDLNPHLSTRLSKLNYKDMLLNDWGIYHFHLGSVSPGQKFSQRTNELLFAIVSEQELAFVDLLTHSPPTNFASRLLLEIIHKNWPTAIARGKVNCQGSKPDPTDDEIFDMRKNGIQVGLQLSDGSVYMAPGGGYATDGSSVEITMLANRIWNAIGSVEDYIRNNENDILTEIAKQSGTSVGSADVELVLSLGEGKLGFEDRKSKILFGPWAY